MYEKIVNYFESNLCVENIYFRRKYILWMVGILATGVKIDFGHESVEML